MEPSPIHCFSRQILPILWWYTALFLGGISFSGRSADAPSTAGTKLPSEFFNAGVLKNCIKYVSWPSAALSPGNGPLLVGLLGHDPFKGHLTELLDSTKIAGRSVRAVVITNLAEISGCLVLFVPSDEQNLWKRWQADPVAATSPILTVSDGAGFLSTGGIIQLDPEIEKFYINLSHSNTREIQLSRLVPYAKTVFRHPSTGPENTPNIRK